MPGDRNNSLNRSHCKGQWLQAASPAGTADRGVVRKRTEDSRRPVEMHHPLTPLSFSFLIWTMGTINGTFFIGF